MKKNLILSRITGYSGDYGYDFPTPEMDCEAFVYDEETDTESDELDYDLIQLNFEDAVSDVKHLAEKYGLTVADYDRGRIYGRFSSSEPFVIVIQDNDGYDSMIGVSVYDNPDYFVVEEDEDPNNYLADLILQDEWYENYCDFVNDLCDNYGWSR